jgi:hypothetical protein
MEASPMHSRDLMSERDSKEQGRLKAFWMSLKRFLLGLVILLGVYTILFFVYGVRLMPAWSGFFTGLEIWFTLAAVIWTIVAFSERQRKQKEKADAARPCEHGTAGAARDIRLCPDCFARFEEREAAARASAEAKRKEEEAKRQKAYREWLARIRLPKYLEQVHPRQFELLVCELFRRLGYEVEATRYSVDSGIDGFLRRAGTTTVLQCKRVKGSVGEPILRDLYGAMHAKKATYALVVTTGRVSDNARKWVQGKPIKIIELDELCSMIRANFPEDEVVPKSFSYQENDPSPEPFVYLPQESCPLCGRALRTVKGRRGKFLECTGYPGCRYTRKINFKYLRHRHSQRL